MSEHAFLRMLELKPPLADRGNGFGAEDLARLAVLDPGQILELALFDVIDEVDGSFGFRDLACAREAARLLRNDVPFSEILAAGAALRDRGIRISEVRLCKTLAGKVAVGGGEHVFEPDGQYALDLVGMPCDVDAVLALAEAAEAEQDWPSAEQLYRLAAHLDPACAEVVFNLGNTLREQGRMDEAIAAYFSAVKRNPSMADAWYNLALVRSRQGQLAQAERCYLAALTGEPDHRDTLFNLALLFTRSGRFDDALPLWERLITLERPGTGLSAAKRAALLCRLELGRAAFSNCTDQAGSVLRLGSAVSR